MLELQDLVENQRKIMGNLEKQLSQKIQRLIIYHKQLIVTHNQNNATANLLDIN